MSSSSTSATMTRTTRFLGALVCILILIVGVGFLWSWTLGLSAFTSYSYALKTAGPVPRAAPDIMFTDQFGRARTLRSLRGRYVLLHAFYGSCGTICPIVIAELHDTYAGLDSGRRRRLAILSVTVDPRTDTTQHLRELWTDQGQFDGWIMAQEAGGSTDRMAKAFGIWVFRRGDGTINHSADLFLMDPRGRIIRVIAPGLSSDRLRGVLEDAI